MTKRLLPLCLFLFCCTIIIAQTTYYSKSTGNLNLTSTWGTATNGTGTSPTNFTSANCTYIIVNNIAPTISANWTVSGINSKVLVGDGTQAINFTVPSTRSVAATFSVMVTSTLTAASGCTVSGSTVHVNGTFNNGCANNPTLGTLGSASSVIYSLAGAQTVIDASYRNLTLSGSGAKTLSNTASTTIAGVLTINSGCTFGLNTNTSFTCTINGTISGAGSVTGGNSANLVIGGSGVLGTLAFTSGSETVDKLIVNRAALGTITLGSSLTVNTTFTHTNGIIALSSGTLTLAGTATLPVSSANGSFSGSSAAGLVFNGNSISNSLWLTSGAQSLNYFSCNTNATVTLGTDMTVVTSYDQTGGIINLNGHTLTLNGKLNLPPSLAQGSFTGSSTSNLIINSTVVTNDRLFMTAGAQTLNNFTFNVPVSQSFKLGSGLSVVGAFTHTSGTLNLNNQNLSVTGTATFPASYAAGHITGNTVSSFTLSASSITNAIYFTTGAQALSGFTFNSSGQTLPLGTPLTLSGAFKHTAGIISIATNSLSLNGTITFPASATAGSITGSTTSTLSIGGAGTITGSLFMTQTGTDNYLNALILNRTAATVTLGNTLNMVGALTPTAGTFASAGNLVLLATASTNVGRIATIGASGAVTGAVLAQMYAKGGKTGWTLLGSPGLTGRTFADWDDNTTITCSTCPDGFFYSFSSVYAYSETVGGLYSNPARYIAITSINTPMSTGKGWWLYLGTSTYTTAVTVLDAKGTVNQGNKTFNLTFTNSGGGTANDHGFTLLANPYPSPIQWSLLRNGNLNVANSVYVYNPDLNGYATYVNGISSPAVGSGGIGNSIPMGQGFYVKAIAATSLTAMETNKTASTQELLKQSSPGVQSSSTPVLTRLNVSGLNMHNETVVYFDGNATTGYDLEYDAMYFAPDPGHIGIGTRLNGNDYTINGMPALNQTYSIPVFVLADSTYTYSISATDLQSLPGGACINLYDNYTGITQDLRAGAYSCTISDTEKVNARFLLTVTMNPSLSVTTIPLNPTCASSADGMVTATVSGSSGPWNYYWRDASGTIIKTTLNKMGPDTLFGLNAGNFSVDANTTGACDNGTQTFSLQGGNPPAGAFSYSPGSIVWYADSVGVTLTNLSSNATAYWWDFGDGMGAACFDTVHYYKAPGDYTVTVYAINQACGDTSVYTEVITIIDGSINGIATVAEPSNSMYISRDENGYYVKFDLNSSSHAEVKVTDLLGEEVITIKQEVSKDKIYIPLNETSPRILIISAATESGDKTFRKVVNY